MPRLTQAEEDALVAELEAEADDPDAWGEPEVFEPRPGFKPGHIFSIRFENELAHRLFARARQLDMDEFDLVRLYVERGLDEDDAAEAAQAQVQAKSA